MKSYRLQPTFGTRPAVEFSGTLVAQASTDRPEVNHWTEVSVYRTEGGSYVLEQIGKTRIPGQKDFVDVFIFGSIEDLQAHMGDTRLAVDVYAQMGIDTIHVR